MGEIAQWNAMEFTEDFGNDETYAFSAPSLEDEIEFAGMSELESWFEEDDIVLSEHLFTTSDRRITLY